MSYDRLSARLFNVPLLVTPEKAEVIAAVFSAYIEGRASELPKVEPTQRIDLATSMSLRRADGGYFTNGSGVAVMQVHGSLAQRAGNLEAASGITGYNGVGAQLTAAMKDPNVRGIVLEIDSPGGEVAGLQELAAMVKKSEKPIYAHANELAASAAYWLGSSAKQLFAPTTGMLGSIGVLMLHMDRSRQIEKAGVVYTPIFAGARKLEGSSIAPLSEEARTNAQARVDQVYGMFTAHVADARDMDEQDVRDTEAGMFSVQDAVAMGLADEVATLSEVVQEMTDELNANSLGSRSFFHARTAETGNRKDPIMTTEAKKPAAVEPAAITQADVDKAKAEGIAEGKALATTEAKAAVDAKAPDQPVDAGKAARDRIKAIQTGAAGKDHPMLAEQLAFETDMSAEAAEAFMAKMPKEARGNPLDAALRGTNPKVGADGDKPDDGGKPIASSSEIFANRRSQIHSVKN